MRVALARLRVLAYPIFFRFVVLLLLCLLLGGFATPDMLLAQNGDPAALDAALSNQFIYQGRLQNGDNLVDGVCDFRFQLFDAASVGNQIGQQQVVSNVTVSNGLFVVVLNQNGQFGSGAFTGERRWLAIAVRCPAGGGSYTALSPRQELSAAPYALYALKAASAASIPWSGVADVPDTIANPPLYTAGPGLQLADNQFSVVFAGSGAANSAARSDHNHFGQLWTGSDPTSGLTIDNTHDSLDSTGLHVYGKGEAVIMAETTGGGSDFKYAVVGISNALGGGVLGEGHATSGLNVFGVLGISHSTTGTGVRGVGLTTTGANKGVHGDTNSTTGTGVLGTAGNVGSVGNDYGVRGVSMSIGGRGVDGRATATSGVSMGVFGSTDSPAGYAGFFSGRVHVQGDFSATGKNFLIDHPLDPENKLLRHSTVESSERLNLYTGNVTLDANGEAEVRLPAWFTALNTDFRYQLTAIGAPGPNLYIAAKLADNRFRIGGGQPGMEVSWSVTGVRHDAYALANPLVVEEEKPADQKGFYLSPAAFGKPYTEGVTHYLNGGDEAAEALQLDFIRAHDSTVR